MNETKSKVTKTNLQPSIITRSFGAYSQGVKVDISGSAQMIFVTGQIALDLEGEVLYPNEAGKQTEFIFERIRIILEEGDAQLTDVVKAQIFLTDMSQFMEVKKVRNRVFEKNKPASTLVEVNRLAKDGCCVEIEAIAIIQS